MMPSFVYPQASVLNKLLKGNAAARISRIVKLLAECYSRGRRRQGPEQPPPDLRQDDAIVIGSNQSVAKMTDDEMREAQ